MVNYAPIRCAATEPRMAKERPEKDELGHARGSGSLSRLFEGLPGRLECLIKCSIGCITERDRQVPINQWTSRQQGCKDEIKEGLSAGCGYWTVMTGVRKEEGEREKTGAQV